MSEHVDQLGVCLKSLVELQEEESKTGMTMERDQKIEGAYELLLNESGFKQTPPDERIKKVSLYNFIVDMSSIVHSLV